MEAMIMKVLVVTPEITYLPQGMGNLANYVYAKGGGLADISSSIAGELFSLGTDIHVAIPHYRKMYRDSSHTRPLHRVILREKNKYFSKLSENRIHLANDELFFEREQVYSSYTLNDTSVAVAFQREVINTIIPRVKPDIIHCNDWMTGLIPAYAKSQGIKTLFTLHNIHTNYTPLSSLKEAGINTDEFEQHLYLSENESNPNDPLVNLLVSGIFASDKVNTVSTTFLEELVTGMHSFIDWDVRKEVISKHSHGHALGVINVPQSNQDPRKDRHIVMNYNSKGFLKGKKRNKASFQKEVGLEIKPNAPILFWPNRLDPVQKGCSLFSDILYQTVRKYWKDNLQVAIVANGPYFENFQKIAKFHNLEHRIAVVNFSERLSNLGYAASDFLMMPSKFEPCGLPQMVGQKYGTLPIVHATGGLVDTVKHIDLKKGTGSGFVFEHYTPSSLAWGIDEAIRFYKQKPEAKNEHIRKIMFNSYKTFHSSKVAHNYKSIYSDLMA